MLVPGAATLPEIDEMRTIWPRPRSRMPAAARRAIMIGARRFTSSAPPVSSTLKSRRGPGRGFVLRDTNATRRPPGRRRGVRDGPVDRPRLVEAAVDARAIGQVRDDG